MPNLNRVLLIGNLTRDPELKYLPSGTAVCEFGLAINRKWKGKDGNQQDETCFVDCQAWARSGEIIAEYCAKGKPLFIEGRLKLDSWEGRDGTKRSKLRVVVENFQLLGSRDARGGQSQESTPPPATDNDADADSDIPF